jgi:hypothetical protein
MLVDHGSKCACFPILAYSVYNAADSIAVAAYVVAISPSGCRTSYMFCFFPCGVGAATWVPFFDNGKFLAEGQFTWGLCLKLTNFVVDAIIFLAPISAFDQVLTEDSQVNRLVRSFYLANFLGSRGSPALGGFGSIVEGTMPKQAAGQGRPRAVPQQMRYPPTQARVWHSSLTICQEL